MTRNIQTLTGREQLGRHQGGEVGLLAIPEDPQLLGRRQREWGRGGRGRKPNVEYAATPTAAIGRRRSHTAPHAQYVTGQTLGVRGENGVLQRLRGGGRQSPLPSSATVHELTPFDTAQVRLKGTIERETC